MLRDLGWLMNTGNLTSVQDLDAYPQVARSVLNYGVPDLSGLTVISADVVRVWNGSIRQAILRFEPRILPAHRPGPGDRGRASEEHEPQRVDVFYRRPALGAAAAPALFLKTEIDLETGHVDVMEESGRLTLTGKPR